MVFNIGTRVKIKLKSFLYNDNTKLLVGVCGEKEGIQKSTKGCSILVHWDGSSQENWELISTRELEVVKKEKAQSATGVRHLSSAPATDTDTVLLADSSSVSAVDTAPAILSQLCAQKTARVLFKAGTKVRIKSKSTLYNESKKDVVGVQIGEKVGVQSSNGGCSIIVHWEDKLQQDEELISTRELEVVKSPRSRSPQPPRSRSPNPAGSLSPQPPRSRSPQPSRAQVPPPERAHSKPINKDAADYKVSGVWYYGVHMYHS